MKKLKNSLYFVKHCAIETHQFEPTELLNPMEYLTKTTTTLKYIDNPKYKNRFGKNFLCFVFLCVCIVLIHLCKSK